MFPVNPPEQSDTTSILCRIIDRCGRPVAFAIAALSAATAILIFLGPDPKITGISAGSFRLVLASTLAVAAVLMLIRAILPNTRWGLPTASLFALVGFIHTSTLGNLVRGPISGVLALIAGALCFIATVTIISTRIESNPKPKGSYLR